MRNRIYFFNSDKKLSIIYKYSSELVNNYSIYYPTHIITLYKYHLNTHPKGGKDKARFKSFRVIFEEYYHTYKKYNNIEFLKLLKNKNNILEFLKLFETKYKY